MGFAGEAFVYAQKGKALRRAWCAAQALCPGAEDPSLGTFFERIPCNPILPETPFASSNCKCQQRRSFPRRRCLRLPAKSASRNPSAKPPQAGVGVTVRRDMGHGFSRLASTLRQRCGVRRPDRFRRLRHPGNSQRSHRSLCRRTECAYRDRRRNPEHSLPTEAVFCIAGSRTHFGDMTLAKVDFVIVSTQRSGSTLLRTSLGSHPQIECFGEIFLPTYSKEQSYQVHLQKHAVSAPMALFRRNRLVYDFLDHFYGSKPDLAVGFKFMYDHARYWPYRFPMVMRYIRKHRCRVIHLVRNNTFDICLSRQFARATRSYHVDEERAQPAMRVDVPLLLQEMRLVERAKIKWRDFLRGFDCLEVSYEHFTTEKSVASRRIADFLEVDPDVSLVSPLKKVLKASKKEIVLNYPEVEAALKGSGYERFLVP